VLNFLRTLSCRVVWEGGGKALLSPII
jgi:hypothetical protein